MDDGIEVATRNEAIEMWESGVPVKVNLPPPHIRKLKTYSVTQFFEACKDYAGNDSLACKMCGYVLGELGLLPDEINGTLLRMLDHIIFDHFLVGNGR